MKQPYEMVLRMPFHRAKKYMEFYMRVQQEIGDGIKKAGEKIRSSTAGKLR